jgi:hypothetical protein
VPATAINEGGDHCPAIIFELMTGSEWSFMAAASTGH